MVRYSLVYTVQNKISINVTKEVEKRYGGKEI